jgi:O-methyltransferase
MARESASEAAKANDGQPAREATREIRAAGPGRGVEELRRAYLDLLKLCLCDLAGAGTSSVERLGSGVVASRELQAEEWGWLRANGRDWPLRALTMSGLRRLDDLQQCVESILAGGISGDLIEVGAWRGGGSVLMRATLDSLGADDRTVWIADSFAGFPRVGSGRRSNTEGLDVDPLSLPGESGWLDDYLAEFDFLAVSADQIKENLARFGCEKGTRLVPGLFEQTLPALSRRNWSLIRLDADTYAATLCALRSLYPGLTAGGYVVIDDYAMADCARAVESFRAEHGIEAPLEQVDWTSARWRRGDDEVIAPERPVPDLQRRANDVIDVARGRGDRRVPTVAELELTRERGELRERLAALQSELARVAGVARQVNEITSSRSWRLTKPLRELNRRLKRRPSA